MFHPTHVLFFKSTYLADPNAQVYSFVPTNNPIESPLPGNGSIHFNLATKIYYVDYSRVSSTRKLDDGTPYPSIKQFINTTLDTKQTPYKFRGEISWLPTASENVTRWTFNMESTFQLKGSYVS